MWQSAKTAIEAVADRLGYAVLPKWRLPNLELAGHLSKLFAAYGIGCVVDVGANAGQYGRFLRDEVGFGGLIVSFEPVPDCFAILHREAALDGNWVALNAALGAVEGDAWLNEMVYSLFSSFLEPNNDRVPDMAALNQVRRRIRVEMRRLDAVIEQIEARRRVGPIYLKLDTQGFDLEVVKGAGAVLDRVRALQAEVSVVPLYDRIEGWQTVIGALQGRGFELSGLWAVARDAALRAVELDCVMVRPTGFGAHREISGEGDDVGY